MYSTDNSVAKFFFYFLNFLFFAVGGTALGFCLYVIIGGAQTGYSFPQGILIGTTCVSAFVLITSFVGCSMVKHRSCLTFYTLLLFVLIVAQITIGALLYKNVLNPNTTLDAVWAGITPADRSKIQEWGSCCGFNGPTDRPELTGKCATPALLSSPGCYPAMEKQFNSSSLAILISALVFLGFEILGFAICLLISFGCCKTEEQKLRERPVFV